MGNTARPAKPNLSRRIVRTFCVGARKGLPGWGDPTTLCRMTNEDSWKLRKAARQHGVRSPMLKLNFAEAVAHSELK